MDERIELPGRRKFFKELGIVSVGGLLWGSHIIAAKAAPFSLRPPAALPEREFLARCTRCGQCVRACPFDTLRLAKPGEPVPAGTPYFIPREIPCHMCAGIPCVPVCPAGALDKRLVSDKEPIDGVRKKALNINLARMGIAIVDRETCVAFWGLQCDVCYRVCPLAGKAITIDLARNERTGKHVYMTPVVHGDYCTGCGLCERACINEKASVFVLPRTVAMGRANARYLRGWRQADEADESKVKSMPAEVLTKTPKSSKSALDYLNSKDF